MSQKNVCCRACSTSKVLDLYQTIEACATIICNLHISPLWLYFRLFLAFYSTVILFYSIAYYIYTGNIKYFMAFLSNWILVIQWIYFLLSSFLTYTIYQSIAPKFERRISNKIRHNVAQKWDVGVTLSNLARQHDINDPARIDSHSAPSKGHKNGNLADIPQTVLQQQASYEIVGAPPNLEKLGYKKLFSFTKSLLEISVTFSSVTSMIYWASLFNGNFDDIAMAMYYINIHGVIVLFQFIDCYGSTYQLRFGYGSLFIFLFSVIAMIWIWLFEELNLVNPFLNTNQLYIIVNWHEDTIQTAIICSIGIVISLVIYWFIVFTKNLALITWKKRRQADNRQLSADDAYYSSDDHDEDTEDV